MRAACLFSGIGGWELAAAQCGIETVWAAEWDEWKAARYRERFPSVALYGDVEGIDGHELRRRHGPIDFLFGSPPAPTSAPPITTVKASMATSRGYTLRPSGSPTKYDLVGAALRTAIGSEFAALTGCAPRWNVRATPAGRSWSQLAMPVRRTSDGDPGLSLPTPSASDYGTNQGGAQGRMGKVRPSLRTMLTDVVIPTPTASDGGVEPDPKRGPKPVTVIKTMLTPTAKDNLDCPAMQKRAGARELMALLHRCMERFGGLATPPVASGRSGKASEATMSRNSRPLNEQLTAIGITQESALLAIFEWQMAFPPGWHGSGGALTETPSSSPSSRELSGAF